MANLIDKDALVAEIKRISCENPMDNSWYVDTEELLNFINTLEVKLEVEEEPVSEDLENYINELSKQFPEVSFAKLSRIVVRVSRWQRNQDVKNKLPKVISRTDLDEYAYQCAYDMSNDWAIDNPTWHDVEMACKLGAKWQKEKDSIISEDLVDATNNYCVNVRKGYPRVMDETDKYICNAFKAGAKWQKQQDQSAIELAEDHAYFAGSEAMREKVLKEIEEAYKKGGVIEAMKIIRELKNESTIH